MPLSQPQIATLRALIDRIIPADDFTGAIAAGTDTFIISILARDGAAEAAALVAGLDELDLEAAARHGLGHRFCSLGAEAQDTLLHDLEQSRPILPWPEPLDPASFFHRIVELTVEGFYADPQNGGNRDAVSWRMVGYDPRLPKQPTAS